jgi:hypothetical protein
MQDDLLLHDNAKLYTSLQTTEAITKLHITVLSCPSYSPDLAPSDFHLFCLMKNAICGQKFRNDDKVIGEVKMWISQTSEVFTT